MKHLTVDITRKRTYISMSLKSMFEQNLFHSLNIRKSIKPEMKRKKKKK